MRTNECVLGVYIETETKNERKRTESSTSRTFYGAD